MGKFYIMVWGQKPSALDTMGCQMAREHRRWVDMQILVKIAFTIVLYHDIHISKLVGSRMFLS